MSRIRGKLGVRAIILLIVLLVIAAAVLTATRPQGVKGAQGDPAPVAALQQPLPTTVPTTTATKIESKSKPKIKIKKKMKDDVRTAASKPTSSSRVKVGTTHRGRATFYAADGGGNCSYPPSGDLMVGAMNQRDYANSAACGSYLAVTGPRGNTITIRVVDRCPECPPGAIDLSAQAFAKLATPSTGQIDIRWHLVSPALKGPIEYVYKTGSSQYWCAVQVRNHRNPVRSVAVLVNGTWKSLPRFEYNYFLSETGAGCGSRIRVTDTAGHQLTDTGIDVSPGQIQKGHAQFPAG